jgi:hypothetical protein
MLKHIKEIKRNLTEVQWWWTADSRVWGESGDTPSRERELHEYPEAQALYWAATCNELDALTKQIAEARAFAYEQYQLTIERGEL